MGTITVFLSDWQVLFREGIHFTLSGEEGLIVTGEATDNREALDFITNNPPDIAIVNINHSEFSGIRFTRHVRQNLPLVSVILVMDTENAEDLYAALKCGASACVAKDIDPDELLGIIRQISEGSVPMGHAVLRPDIASKILEDFESYTALNTEVDDLLARLTVREKDILTGIVNGSAVGEIGKDAGIGAGDIAKYMEVIRKKLVVNELCRDVVEAAQKGLSSVIKRTRGGKKQQDYISRDEFEAFRDSLIDHFRTFTER